MTLLPLHRKTDPAVASKYFSCSSCDLGLETGCCIPKQRLRGEAEEAWVVENRQYTGLYENLIES